MDRVKVDMLNAMGITVWVPRDAAPATAEPVVEPPPAPAPKAAQVKPSPAPAPDPGTATMTWAALEAAVAQCTACRLHATRTQTVFGVGNRSAEWMIIGEGPGYEEDKRGEPFVGPAGKLLNAMLQATGRAREDVYIANVVKCRPPENRNPQPDEAARCEPFLARQIALIRPKVILAVGKVAANNLLGTEASLARLRGKVHRHPKFDIPIVVTYHPAYLLRQPQDKRKSWMDLKLAMEVTA
ncbi:MAG TPA: uracil-DNA glycosylase [Gammaproteobacteria bacterium]|nr:uracil-DNA glycosylase [Gammaproteobacteria bacterium]